ncbi:MAG: STAS domain-containing protein, partial [Exilispira sp.]
MENKEKNIISYPLIQDYLVINKNQDLIDEFFNKIDEMTKQKVNLIILDFTNLDSINSYILARLIYFQKKVSKYKGRIKLINIDENIKKIFKS